MWSLMFFAEMDLLRDMECTSRVEHVRLVDDLFHASLHGGVWLLAGRHQHFLGRAQEMVA